MMNALARCGVFVLLCGLPLCGGCIKPHNYQEVMPNLNATGTGPVVVVTHDERPYVASGGTSQTFVGLVRSAMGVPWAAHTDSGRPLAEEMTEIISRALSKRGFQCRAVFVPASMGADEVRRKLQAPTGAIALLLVLREWKSDTHTDTALAYDMNLSVFDSYGVSLAETRIHGRDVLGDASVGNALTGSGMKFAVAAVPQVLQKKLEELLNAPMIITALQTGKRPSSVPLQVDQQPVALPPAVPQQREPPLEGSQRVLSQERTTKVAVVQLQHQYDAFRLFVQPNTGAERLGSVSAGVPLKVIEERQQWLYVETPDESRGWILRAWIQE